MFLIFIRRNNLFIIYTLYRCQCTVIFIIIIIIDILIYFYILLLLLLVLLTENVICVYKKLLFLSKYYKMYTTLFETKNG